MATSTLKMKFGTASGTKTWSFPQSKSTLSSATVRTLAERMIANGSIYKYPPLELQSAVIEVTTENIIDITQ